jgi:hypothetical protein
LWERLFFGKKRGKLKIETVCEGERKKERDLAL